MPSITRSIRIICDKGTFVLFSNWHLGSISVVWTEGTGDASHCGRALCQGRSKTRPQGRSKSRPEERVGDRGLSGRRTSGAEACAACKAARLGRGGRRPSPRRVFAAAGSGGEVKGGG